MCRLRRLSRMAPGRTELLVAGLGFLLRVQGLGFQSLWRDEVDSLRFAAQPLSHLLGAFVAPGQNGPLYYLLLSPWQSVAGKTEFSLRFLSVVAGTLSVPLVYRLGRRLAPSAPGVGVVGSLLAAVSPYLIWYSQEARMYAAVVCLSLGSMECLLGAAAAGEKRRWFAYAALTGATFYLHFLTALMVPVHVVAALLGRRHRPLALRRGLVALAGLAVLYLPLLRWQLPALRSAADNGYSFVTLGQMLSTLAFSYSGGVLARWPLGVLVSFFALVFAVFVWSERDELRAAGVLVSWLLVPVIVFYLLTLVRPMFLPRYLTFVLPALVLLAGMGWRALARRSLWLAGLPVAVIVALGLASARQQATVPIKADMRSATRFVVSQREPDEAILFQIPYTRHAFEYYAVSLRSLRSRGTGAGAGSKFFPLVGGASPTWWIDGPYTNAGMSRSDVDSAMRSTVGDRETVWLVACEVALWDERDLVRSWLVEHGTLTHQADYVGVTVYRYDLRRDTSDARAQQFVMA